MSYINTKHEKHEKAKTWRTSFFDNVLRNKHINELVKYCFISCHKIINQMKGIHQNFFSIEKTYSSSHANWKKLTIFLDKKNNTSRTSERQKGKICIPVLLFFYFPIHAMKFCFICTNNCFEFYSHENDNYSLVLSFFFCSQFFLPKWWL